MLKKLFLILLCLLPISAYAVDMELKGLDGSVSKLSDYRGKWVVVNYWATWCPPCLEEMPELQSWHDHHAEKDGVVLGLNAEFMPLEDIKTFLDEYFITYPNFSAGPVSRTPLGSVPGLPTTFLISPQGNVEAKQVGAITRQMIESFIVKWEAAQHNKKTQ